MGTSHSQYRPHSQHRSHPYFGITWGQPHHVNSPYGHHHHHHHHHHSRPAFGFGRPPPHLRKRC